MRPARSIDETPEQAAPLRLVCFHLHGQEHALPIGSVRETLELRPITRIFLTPAWLAGIFSLRGELVPAIDVAQWLGLGPIVVGSTTRIIVLRNKARVLGLLADDLAELRTVASNVPLARPATLSAEQLALLAGVVTTETGTVRIFDPDAILRSDRLQSLGTPAS